MSSRLVVPGDRVPPELEAATVLDVAGAPHRLGSYWADGPCLLVLLRHFGCVGCAQQVTELAPRLDEFARLGVHVVLVGNGTADQLAAFAEREGLTAAPATTLVTDPGLGAYRALGLHRSVWAVAGPRALYEMLRAWGAGVPHRGFLGDATQQGGAFLIDRGGVVRFAKRNVSLGDHAPASDLVLAAVKLAVRERPEAVHV